MEPPREYDEDMGLETLTEALKREQERIARWDAADLVVLSDLKDDAEHDEGCEGPDDDYPEGAPCESTHSGDSGATVGQLSASFARRSISMSISPPTRSSGSRSRSGSRSDSDGSPARCRSRSRSRNRSRSRSRRRSSSPSKNSSSSRGRPRSSSRSRPRSSSRSRKRPRSSSRWGSSSRSRRRCRSPSRSRRDKRARRRYRSRHSSSASSPRSRDRSPDRIVTRCIVDKAPRSRAARRSPRSRGRGRGGPPRMGFSLNAPRSPSGRPASRSPALREAFPSPGSRTPSTPAKCISDDDAEKPSANAFDVACRRAQEIDEMLDSMLDKSSNSTQLAGPAPPPVPAPASTATPIVIKMEFSQTPARMGSSLQKTPSTAETVLLKREPSRTPASVRPKKTTQQQQSPAYRIKQESVRTPAARDTSKTSPIKTQSSGKTPSTGKAGSTSRSADKKCAASREVVRKESPSAESGTVKKEVAESGIELVKKERQVQGIVVVKREGSTWGIVKSPWSTSRWDSTTAPVKRAASTPSPAPDTPGHATPVEEAPREANGKRDRASRSPSRSSDGWPSKKALVCPSVSSASNSPTRTDSRSSTRSMGFTMQTDNSDLEEDHDLLERLSASSHGARRGRGGGLGTRGGRGGGRGGGFGGRGGGLGSRGGGLGAGRLFPWARTRCNLCQNHGLDVAFSMDHKRRCAYFSCCCEACISTILLLTRDYNTVHRFLAKKDAVMEELRRGTKEGRSRSPRRKVSCLYCRNHGKDSTFTFAHKVHCPRKLNCSCEACLRSTVRLRAKAAARLKRVCVDCERHDLRVGDGPYHDCPYRRCTCARCYRPPRSARPAAPGTLVASYGSDDENETDAEHGVKKVSDGVQNYCLLRPLPLLLCMHVRPPFPSGGRGTASECFAVALATIFFF